MAKKNENTSSKNQTYYPPVVAVLGHVDHGKTTLLDVVRKTSVAKREHGGITQNIGASEIEIIYEDKKRKITFIDTPGHEAFSNMRSRGAQAADIGLLIVSAVDGVMPQTKESIQLLKEANIPYIAVLTMSDLPTKNPERVKQQLLRENVLLEGYGGDIPVMEISANTGMGIKELLDLILLVAEVRKVNDQASADGRLKAIVIESKLDQRIGAKSTIIVKNGTIRVRDDVTSDGITFRVRSVFNYLVKPLIQASVGEGVELLGAPQVLAVGSIITEKNEVESKPVKVAVSVNPADVIYHKTNDENKLSIVLTADTQGSLEAITAALPKDVVIVYQKTGEITEADVLQAKAVHAIVVSFNTRIRSEVQKLALAEKVLIKNYKIIYEMLDEIKDVLEGKQQMKLETILGRAKILASFPYEKTLAYGVNVIEGRMARKDRIRIMRDDKVIGESSIESLRVGKNITTKVSKGEAGIVFSHPLDITIGDMVTSIA